MEEPKHDLPTLHRPVTKDIVDSSVELRRELNPLPTPPHKPPRHITMIRPQTSVGFKGPSGTLPSILNDTNWRIRRAKQEEDMLPEVDDFEQTYVDLVAKRAYRHPHPGAPKGREGCMGGTWRHMKEAIGYGPGRLMWIDGVVTLYDTESLNNERPWRGCTAVERIGLQGGGGVPSRHRQLHHQLQGGALNRGRYIIPHTKINNQTIIDRSNHWYSSNQPQPLPFAEQPPMSNAPAGKYKGFYTMAQTYS